MTITRHRFLATPELQSEDRYHRLPFEVPAGSRSLSVRLSFDPSLGGIDLGCEGADGWRGWSGGARTDYVIGTDEATTGYLPGPLEPGEWQVVLGLHRVPARGVPVEVEIAVPADRPVVAPPQVAPAVRRLRGSDRGLPAEPGLTWYAGDFHGHTLHSDGELPIGGLAALAVASGLDFMAVTDHNTVSHHAHLPAEGARHGIALLPGQEVTTHRGHANAFGDIGWIDFRQPALEWVRTVAARGGTLSINHPISGDCSWLHRLPQRPAAVELWHATWYRELISTAPLAWFTTWPAGATLIGGSDTHLVREPQRPGTPTTWVAAEEPTAEAILAGLAAGRTAITGAVDHDGGVLTPRLMDAPTLLRVAGELVAVDAEGLLLTDGLGRRRSVTAARQSFAGEPSEGPYSLINPDRTILALCA
ncbi:MAG: CehA/McbA family metallohydrolase [Propionicimonas sp.]|uniref:CehA/McbA family metallohydrolase n=1 Tax=Propionicimonas sp. TaxID=1955623 RepID=UPI002B1EC0B5|nr:CehA/McbA family metallohydrolase [Propionicimonas sp.]MEA4945571.1 CehA/McbA family metallohydrolase [Propionicimonas sp.]MEA5054178.1 CehA/McbA family metallohydrolase [Propionicimonas sp.]